MEAKPSTLEITVLSGENLCIDGKPVKENVYVVVRAESLKCCTTTMAKDTSTESSSSSFLSWNEKLLLDIHDHARSITFEVRCKTSKGHVRNVGVARIGLSEFMEGKTMKVLSYGLRDWNGRRNGVIHFTVKVPEEKLSSDMKPVPAKGMSESCGVFETEAMGFQVDKNNPNGVVLGIPVR